MLLIIKVKYYLIETYALGFINTKRVRHRNRELLVVSVLTYYARTAATTIK